MWKERVREKDREGEGGREEEKKKKGIWTDRQSYNEQGHKRVPTHAALNATEM